MRRVNYAIARFAETPPDPAETKKRTAERRRFSYRRLRLLLKREGVNVKQRKRLKVKRRGRKRALGARADGDPAGGEPELEPQGGFTISATVP